MYTKVKDEEMKGMAAAFRAVVSDHPHRDVPVVHRALGDNLSLLGVAAQLEKAAKLFGGTAFAHALVESHVRVSRGAGDTPDFEQAANSLVKGLLYTTPYSS